MLLGAGKVSRKNFLDLVIFGKKIFGLGDFWRILGLVVLALVGMARYYWVAEKLVGKIFWT
jgi:hypothetical protein